MYLTVNDNSKLLEVNNTHCYLLLLDVYKAFDLVQIAKLLLQYAIKVFSNFVHKNFMVI